MEPTIMELGQADRAEIKLDRHDETREVLVKTVYSESAEVDVAYPNTSLDGGRMFGNLQETIPAESVVRITD